jgi:hypothetical protein
MIPKSADLTPDSRHRLCQPEVNHLDHELQPVHRAIEVLKSKPPNDKLADTFRFSRQDGLRAVRLVTGCHDQKKNGTARRPSLPTKLIPRRARSVSTCARIDALFSPMPPVKMRASIEESAVIRPRSARARR